ncbi:MAG: TlpA disulfide reductase family protein [Bacteroidota bacterium]
MKTHFYLLLTCLLVSITAFSQTITLKGKITDADTMMVLLRGITQCDTVFTQNGLFSITRKLQAPELLTLICVKNKQSIEAIKENNERKMRSLEDGVSRELFLEGGEVTIKSSFANIKTVSISSALHTVQDIYNEFKKRFSPLVKMARTIIDSSYQPKRSDQEKKVFDMLFHRINEIENEVAEQFVMENSNNVVGAYILYRYCRIDNHHKLDSLYRLFNPSLQATSYLQNIKDKINALAALKPGENTPDFSLRNSNNHIIGLSDFKGKYIVLDFWGSWCMPCINGFPKMKTYYKKYNAEITFLGIACNDTEKAWRNAISKYDLNWQHVLNGEGINNIAVRYNIEAYPTKVLIDKDGKLVQVFTGETEGFYQKLDALFGN